MIRSDSDTFARAAADYEQFNRMPWGKLIHSSIWHQLAGHMRTGHTVLDIGSGLGETAIHLAGLGHAVCAAEPTQMVRLEYELGGLSPYRDIAQLTHLVMQKAGS